jgi:hypothetical protein
MSGACAFSFLFVTEDDIKYSIQSHDVEPLRKWFCKDKKFITSSLMYRTVPIHNSPFAHKYDEYFYVHDTSQITIEKPLTCLEVAADKCPAVYDELLRFVREEDKIWEILWPCISIFILSKDHDRLLRLLDNIKDIYINDNIHTKIMVDLKRSYDEDDQSSWNMTRHALLRKMKCTKGKKGNDS